MNKTSADHIQAVKSRKIYSARQRTTSATDSNQPITTFESLSIDNNQDANKRTSRDTSPALRARRFSGDIVLPSSSSSDLSDPSLFSPGSVRARTISSIQENKNLPQLGKKSGSQSSPPPETPPPTKRIDIHLSSGKTVHTSDFIHSNHEQPLVNTPLINPHAEVHSAQRQPQHSQLSNETARNKLLQSVYVNNTNTSNSSLLEPLTNGTSYHTNPAESASNCVLS